MVGFIFFLIYLFVRFIIDFTNFCLFFNKGAEDHDQDNTAYRS